ncbi:MAG TPA: DUF1573 domain-containing protein [Vicinamibacteria bacterium]
MRRVALAALLALPLPACAPAPQPPPKAPSITVEPARFDFGRVLVRRVVHKDFTVRNHGGADLVIEDVSTTCGCAAALPDRTVVAPGTATPLRVSLDTEASPGRVTRRVRLRSNDPRRPEVELVLEATVVAAES